MSKNILLGIASLLIALALSLAPMSMAAADPVCYVDLSAAGADDGSSWGDAYVDLQDALADPGCTEIWVAEGTYLPDGATPGDINLSFELKNSVGIYGGFDGSEALRAQRDWERNETTLSGDLAGDDDNFFSNIADNSYHVVRGTGLNSSAILDGFIIRGGNATDPGVDTGGGMELINASPTLTNLYFTLNGALGGGGLYAFNNSDTTLTNVFFDTNLAFGGAGMVAELSSPGLFQVVFIDNIALFGGGIAILDAAATLNQVAFLGNLAAFEGGGLYNDLSTTTLENATFVNNDAGDGGGIYNIEATLELTNITFFGNIASFDGGAVLNFDGLMLMNNVTLADNQATDGGGIFNTDSGLVDAFNSIFWNNSPTEIENDLSTSSIVDSIVDGGCPAGSTCTNVVNADPLLNPLADNGGFSSTMSLQAGSPAVDAAGGSQACAASDQRGVSRPQGAGCDMGAVEVGDDTPPTVTSTSLLSRYTGKGPSQFTVAFSEAMNDTAGNSGANDVTNADNYLLIEAGANEVVDTKSCASGLQGDDVQVEVIDVVYNSASFTTTVFLPDELSIGVYRLFVCGTSTLTDASLNALNDGEDTKVNFIVGEDAESGDKGSLDLADSGTTEFHFRRITVFVPENAVPGGETNCRIVITMKGDSGVYGFSLNDTLWDVKIVCDHGEVTMFYAPLTICIRPVDGVVADKQLFHRHSGSFNPLARTAYLTGSVCGQTRFLSLFTLAELSLPETGFAPGVETIRGPQPAEMAYTASDLMLSIPTLGVQLDIVGVPQSANGWDVSWLASSQAGYLYGTAFPTWAGNSVLTAHVWNADNTAGPFHQLKALQAGDQLSITAGGSTYTYAVRSNELVSERNLAVMAQSNSSMITLVTCEGFMEGSGEYRFRRVVQAVLISVD